MSSVFVAFYCGPSRCLRPSHDGDSEEKERSREKEEGESSRLRQLRMRFTVVSGLACYTLCAPLLIQRSIKQKRRRLKGGMVEEKFFVVRVLCRLQQRHESFEGVRAKGDAAAQRRQSQTDLQMGDRCGSPVAQREGERRRGQMIGGLSVSIVARDT